MEDVPGLGGRCCHAVSNADGLQTCAHQNVGWGLLITSIFVHHLGPLFLGGVWVCLQVFSCPWWSFVILHEGLESVWEGWAPTVQFPGVRKYP